MKIVGYLKLIRNSEIRNSVRGFTRKIRLIYGGTTCETSLIHMLPNISRSKSNMAMKFDQLKKCNIRSNFIEQVFTKELEKVSPDFFLKHHIWAYIWINSRKFYTACFGYIASWGLSKYISKFPNKLQTTRI